MRTVKDWWDNFDKLVIPAGAGAVQRTEMRRAFYAGFFSCLEGSGEIVDACGDDENLGAAMMGLEGTLRKREATVLMEAKGRVEQDRTPSPGDPPEAPDHSKVQSSG